MQRCVLQARMAARTPASEIVIARRRAQMFVTTCRAAPHCPRAVPPQAGTQTCPVEYGGQHAVVRAPRVQATAHAEMLVFERMARDMDDDAARALCARATLYVHCTCPHCEQR